MAGIWGRQLVNVGYFVVAVVVIVGGGGVGDAVVVFCCVWSYDFVLPCVIFWGYIFVFGRRDGCSGCCCTRWRSFAGVRLGVPAVLCDDGQALFAHSGEGVTAAVVHIYFFVFVFFFSHFGVAMTDIRGDE